MKKEKRKWEAVESDVADFDEEAAGFTKDELAACVHVRRWMWEYTRMHARARASGQTERTDRATAAGLQLGSPFLV